MNGDQARILELKVELERLQNKYETLQIQCRAMQATMKRIARELDLLSD